MGALSMGGYAPSLSLNVASLAARSLAYRGTEWVERARLARARHQWLSASTMGVATLPRSLAAPALCAAVMALPALPILALAVGPYIAPASWSEPYLAADRNARAVELTDFAGTWLGVVPAAMRISPASRPRPAYLSIDTDPPADFWNLLTALEDRNLDRPWTVNGVDVLALARAVPSLISPKIGRGGSGLAMMLVREMHDLDPQSGTRMDKLRRKILEVTDGPVLFRRLGGNSPAFRKMVSRNFALVMGAPGSRMGTPLHGVGMAAHVLWNKSADQLDLSQSAILAAAVKHPIILAPDGDAQGALARDTRWKLVVERAILGVKLAYAGRPDIQAAAIGELQAMSAPRPQLDAETPASGNSSSDLFLTAANPEKRAAVLIGQEMIDAQGELRNRLGGAADDVAAIKLSLDAAENTLFSNQVEDRLSAAEVRIGGGMTTTLMPHDGQAPTADVVVAVARNGRIVRFYSNSQEPLFNGGLGERDRDTLVYDPRLGRRPVGSIAKAAIAVLLGRTDSPSARYCNEALPGDQIHNSDGDAGQSCADPAAWLPVQTVFAHSKNLPVIWRLKSIPAVALQAAAEADRLRLPSGVAPRVAFPLGLATARPEDVLTLLDTIGRGEAGQPAIGRDPYLVASYRLTGEGFWRTTAPRDQTLDLRPEFKAPGVAPYVRVALTAPLMAGGTLAGVADAVPEAHDFIGKSGTTTAANGNVRDKYAAGSFTIRGDRYSFVVLVGARNPTTGLGPHIPWPAFYPLIRLALSSAVARDTTLQPPP